MSEERVAAQPLDTVLVPPDVAVRLRSAWPDPRTAALADVVLAPSAEVFELRARLTLGAQDGPQALDRLADDYTARVLAPLFVTAGGDRA